MKRLAFILLFLPAGAKSQTAPVHVEDVALPPEAMHRLLSDSSVTFTMVPRANEADAFEIWLGPDGKGEYRLTKGEHAPQAIKVSQAVWQTVEGGQNAANSQRCETKLKNIAKTGKKTISYVLGPSTPVMCEFDYTDDKELSAAVIAFEGIAETIRMGELLKHNLRYDRLGLDVDMDALVDEVKSGAAIEVQNIAPMLQLLVDDDRVMERVKRKAAHLLEGAGIAVKDYPAETSAR